MTAAGGDDVARLAALDEPVRRRLFDYVRGSAEPVSREKAAEAVGIGRSLAAYHLDKLAEQGLLIVTYRRPEGRGGPGAGRPAKLYAAQGEISVSVPPRDYELAAELLAEAAETSGEVGRRSTTWPPAPGGGWARTSKDPSRRPLPAAGTSPSRTSRASSGSGTAPSTGWPSSTATSSAG